MTCPIARSLDVVGEWWTLLIIRDALAGSTRFEEFRQIGIADNILSSRLDLLVGEGILERRAYQERPLRHEYVLTEKGRDLLPVIVGLARWGLRWTDAPDGPPRLIHTPCGTELGLDFLCAACGETVGPAEILVEGCSVEATTPDEAGRRETTELSEVR
jgi:DNA-binding HxlR family transcriptional regulator